MAEIIPLEAPTDATRGEKQLFTLLKTVLVPDAEFIVWFEPKPGDVKLRPDFLVWSQRMGLLIIEVKDWVIGQIQEMNATQCKILRGERSEEHPSPTHQAYRYSLAYRDFLCRHTEFRDVKEGHTGEVKFPVGYCAAFTNIRREEAKELARVLGGASCLFAEDLEIDLASSDARLEFVSKLRNAFSVKFSFDPLSAEELETLRNSISPVFRPPKRDCNGPAGIHARKPTKVLDEGPASPSVSSRRSSSFKGWLIATAIVLWLTVLILIRPTSPVLRPTIEPSIPGPNSSGKGEVQTKPKRKPRSERRKIPDATAASPASSVEDVNNSEISAQPSILTVIVQQVRFTVTSCSANGNALSCDIAIRSVRGDRELTVFVHEYVTPTSRMIDSTGKEYVADGANLGSRENLGVSAQSVLVEGVAVTARLHFHRVAPNIGSIALLEVAGEIGNQTFKAQFKSVPVLSSASSSMNLDGGSSPG